MLEGNPDLYGPVWIATTVVVILFMTGTISQYLAHAGKEHFAYDFKLLSGGAGLIYGYTAIVPVALWAALKWWGSESANLLEVLALYGYSNLIWIPVALISWSPISSESPPFPLITRWDEACDKLTFLLLYSPELRLRRSWFRRLRLLPPT